MDTKLSAQVEEGKLVFHRPEVVNAYLQKYEGKVLEVIIRPPSKAKTLNQLAYLHGVVFVCISQDTGYTVEEIKGLLKSHFLTAYATKKDGQEFPYVRSLADLTVSEMAEFIEDCVMLAASHWSIVVPAVNEMA